MSCSPKPSQTDSVNWERRGLSNYSIKRTTLKVDNDGAVEATSVHIEPDRSALFVARDFQFDLEPVESRHQLIRIGACPVFVMELERRASSTRCRRYSL